MKRTNRGFWIFSEFKDSYDQTITVQESSSINKRCWIFVKNKDGNDGFEDKAGGGFHSYSAHLSPAQAKRLIKALERFIES